MIPNLCPALKRANITNPESQAGKDFCTQKCPYPDCIVADGTLYEMKLTNEKARVRRLYKKGMTTEEIATKIRKSVRSVQRYLK